jgi:hypothetical protein
METLIAVVNSTLYIFNYKTDVDRRVNQFFFVYLYSIELLNKYSNILLLDYIYKTNYFKIFLLNIVSSIYIYKIYYISFYFLHNETKESYI